MACTGDSDAQFCIGFPTGDIGEFDGVHGVFEARLLVICNFGAAPIDLMFIL